jgi:cytochrome c-type biogenesis protein CcmH
MRILRIITLGLALATSFPALAVEPDEILPDPAMEARARTLSHELRCMVCQNQSIDDSNAPLARDLRLLVRERLKAGDSDTQVIDFLVARYGEFVLLRPRFEWHNLILWLGPPAALVAGGLALFMMARRRKGSGGERPAEPAKLTPEQEARLARIVKAGES